MKKWYEQQVIKLREFAQLVSLFSTFLGTLQEENILDASMLRQQSVTNITGIPESTL